MGRFGRSPLALSTLRHLLKESVSDSDILTFFALATQPFRHDLKRPYAFLTLIDSGMRSGLWLCTHSNCMCNYSSILELGKKTPSVSEMAGPEVTPNSAFLATSFSNQYLGFKPDAV